MKRRAITAITVFGAASVAAAQPGGADRAQAEALFRRGKELMATGKTAEACDAFDASQKLEPTISTLMNQGNCREKNDQLATAWGLFLEAARQTRGAKDQAGKQLAIVSSDRAAKLERRLSSIRIVVSPEHRVTGLQVLRDGQPIDPATWNTKLPIDGGTFEITARAPNRELWSTTIQVAIEKDAKTVEVPALAATQPTPSEPVATPTAVSSSPAPVVVPAPEASTPAKRHSVMSRRRWVAAGVGVGGITALAIGTGLGLSAKNQQRDAEALCPDPEMPCSDAVRASDLTRQGHDRAFQANLAFALGGAALVGAGVLWFTGKPDDVSLVARVAPAEAGIGIAGRF